MESGGDNERVDRQVFELPGFLDELHDQLQRLLGSHARGHLRTSKRAFLVGLERTLDLVEHRRLQIARQAGCQELGSDPDRGRNSAVGLLAPLPARGGLDEAGSQEHLDVEVKVARIDAEALCELAIGQRVLALAAEHLEHAQAQRVAESLELLGPLDREDVRGRRRGGL